MRNICVCMRHFLRKKSMQISVLNCVIWFMLCDCMDLLLLRHGCEVNVALLLIYAAFLLENYKNIILVGCWSLFFFAFSNSYRVPMVCYFFSLIQTLDVMCPHYEWGMYQKSLWWVLLHLSVELQI